MQPKTEVPAGCQTAIGIGNTYCPFPRLAPVSWIAGIVRSAPCYLGHHHCQYMSSFKRYCLVSGLTRTNSSWRPPSVSDGQELIVIVEQCFSPTTRFLSEASSMVTNVTVEEAAESVSTSLPWTRELGRVKNEAIVEVGPGESGAGTGRRGTHQPGGGAAGGRGGGGRGPGAAGRGGGGG